MGNNAYHKKKLLALNRVSASRSREKKKMLHIQMDIKSEVIESRNIQLKKRLVRMQSLKDYLNTFISCQKRVFLFESQQISTTPSTSTLITLPSTSTSSSSSSSSSPYNIPSSLFFSSTQSDESNEKRPIQVQTKTQKKVLRRSRRRDITDEEDRRLSQSLKRLYQEIEEQQVTSLNVDEEKRLLNEFFSLLPIEERSSLLTCSAALMSDGNRDLNQIELETNNVNFASINNDIQHLLNVDFIDSNLD